MTPRKQSTSPWLSYLLMGGILSFGGGAAYMVLSDSPGKPTPSHQAPPALAATPAAVRAAVAPTVRQAPKAPVAPVAVAVAQAPAAPAKSMAAAPVPAAVVRAPVPAPVATPVAVAAVPVAVPTAALPVPANPAVKAPVRMEKPEPAVPVADVVDALRIAVPSSTTRVSPAAAPAKPAAAPVKAAEVAAVAVPAVKAAPAPAKVIAPAPVAAKPVKPKRAEVKPSPVKSEVKVAVKPKAELVVKEPQLPVPRAIPVPRTIAVPQEIALPPMKGLPKLDVPTAERPAASEEIVESRPDAKPDAKPESKTVAKPTVEAAKPVVKSMHAAPLVPTTSKPTLVMANGDKAWVKLDEQRTVIITKGQAVPGLGTFHGADKSGAKFDSGTVPVNQ